MRGLFSISIGFASVSADIEVETGSLLQNTRLMNEIDGNGEISVGRDTVSSGFVPKEGLMPAVMPGLARPKLIMAVDVDYPPYAYIQDAPYGSSSDLDDVQGVGVEIIKGMANHCNFDVSVMRAHWSDCWTNGEIGQGLLQGWYHGCMTYTHAAGVRNQYLEFSNSWAIPNKPSGLIVKLHDGVPAFSGLDDLSGKTIVDVTGWAPTAETLYFVKNQCTGEPYREFNIIQGDDIAIDRASEAKGPNDRALLAVLEGKADAMWIYGDQAANYQCAEGQTTDGWNCDLWNKFGSEFAYVQSGMFSWMHNGTTVSMSKKGSGVSAFLDDCFEQYRVSEDFYNVCKKIHGDHNQLSTCIPNDFFHADPEYEEVDIVHSPYMFATSDHSLMQKNKGQLKKKKGDGGSGCSSGYCPCPAADGTY